MLNCESLYYVSMTQKLVRQRSRPRLQFWHGGGTSMFTYRRLCAHRIGASSWARRKGEQFSGWTLSTVRKLSFLFTSSYSMSAQKCHCGAAFITSGLRLEIQADGAHPRLNLLMHLNHPHLMTSSSLRSTGFCGYSVSHNCLPAQYC